MKITKVTYVIYDEEGDELEIFSEKHKETAIARVTCRGGILRKRIETIEELMPLDEDCTIWI